MNSWRTALTHLAWFTRQEALSCLFPGILFLTFGLTKLIAPDLPPGVYRYDVIFVVCLLAQWGMYRWGLESRDEVKVIAVFHLIGLALELFKTHCGSWSYPEPGLTKLCGVPLFSGFMYAGVASYLCQAWRRLDVRLIRWPASAWTMPLVAAIYLNFFTEHVLPDLRWILVLLIVILFRRTRVEFGTDAQRARMPLPVAFVLIGFFIWIAENIATRLGAWQYPHQQSHWHMVHWQKISSWSLLCILTFLIVAQLKHFKEGRAGYNGCGKREDHERTHAHNGPERILDARSPGGSRAGRVRRRGAHRLRRRPAGGGEVKIVARGHNRMNALQNKVAHAEIVTFFDAARPEGEPPALPLDCKDAILVSTLEPCVMCLGAAMEAGVCTVVFGLTAPAGNGTRRVKPPGSRRRFVEWLRGKEGTEQAAFVEQLPALTTDPSA